MILPFSTPGSGTISILSESPSLSSPCGQTINIGFSINNSFKINIFETKLAICLAVSI